MQIQPRLIRLRDAPAYLGMDRNRFNREVRTKLTEIPIGKQGIAFDRLEMDAWAEQYISRCGCSVSGGVSQRKAINGAARISSRKTSLKFTSISSASRKPL